jgi:hypothetical protein
MLGQLPYDYRVQRGLELLLEEHGLYFPHAIVAATKDIQRLTYTLRVNALAKPVLAKCLENLLRRRFSTEDEGWIVQPEEAQVLAVIGGWEPDKA